MKSVVLLLGACLLAAPAARAQAPEPADAKREHDLKIPEIIRGLGLKEGSRVADIGAGDGFYDMAMSRTVGAAGRVYAVVFRLIRARTSERFVRSHIHNHETPVFPERGLDVFQHLFVVGDPVVRDHHQDSIQRAGRQLGTVGHSEDDLHVLEMVLLHRHAGFEVVSRDDHFIDNPDEESTRSMLASIPKAVVTAAPPRPYYSTGPLA
ncbi:exported hypothetical protein [Candidatus Sulfopaludibacter sp. SbA4]|nr:exported hypothetical protein [Candidatus Sulfopaludibacter sp. SbA4]